MEEGAGVEEEYYNAGLDEVQRHKIWTYKEKTPGQSKLASLEAWTCLIGRALNKKRTQGPRRPLTLRAGP